MLIKNRQKSGFTIVELLIVVVVIAILAAITIVAYNGIQQRARNTQIIAGTSVYRKALQLYAQENGSYPAASGCLGSGYPSNECWSGPNGIWAVNSGLDGMLSTYLPSKPIVATKQLRITNAPDLRMGALYQYNSATDIKIIYYLEGAGQKCMNGSVGFDEMQGTQCSIQL
jgi:prepilin-type N-terminal cleavage/methylation domain-containing protein